MKFFELEQEPIADKQIACTDVLKADGTHRGDAPRCEKCGKYVGLLRWLPPFRVELTTWGTEYGDLAKTGTDLVVSLHFKEAWERSGLVGLSGFERVKIVKLKRRRKSIGDPPAYFHATVHRSQTAIDQKASGMKWEKPPTCPVCLKGDMVIRWKRIVIDEPTWTGEDVFFARGLPGTIVVSERFKEFSERNSLKNIFLIPAEKAGYDSYGARRKKS